MANKNQKINAVVNPNAHSKEDFSPKASSKEDFSPKPPSEEKFITSEWIVKLELNQLKDPWKGHHDLFNKAFNKATECTTAFDIKKSIYLSWVSLQILETHDMNFLIDFIQKSPLKDYDQMKKFIKD